MVKIGEQYQSADWKKEKHVPVIDCPDKVESDEMFEVTASMKITKSGTLFATSLCNIHGLWENSKKINVS